MSVVNEREALSTWKKEGLRIKCSGLGRASKEVLRPQNRNRDSRRPQVFGGSRISPRKELENEGFRNHGGQLGKALKD